MGKIADITDIVRRSGILEQGDRVLAGVSGGADSVCLFLVLKELSGWIGFDLSVVHVEHGLRGEESVADAAFVQQLCEANGVPFLLKRVDVRAAATTHVSEEETARNLRREAFLEAAAMLYPNGTVKVALAHNADDQAETVLMHLLRGTGIRGLCGMRREAVLRDTVDQNETKEGRMEKRTERDVRIIRPLLTVSRSDIESYLAKKDQTYRTDATNLEDTYTRNRMRHRILPLLSEINAQAVGHIGQTALALQEIEDEIERQATIAAKEVIIELRLNRVLAAAYSAEMQNKIIKSWIYKRNGTVRNVSSTHICAIREMLSAPNGRKLDIPGPYRARVEGDYLVWEEKTGRNAPKNRPVSG